MRLAAVSAAQNLLAIASSPKRSSLHEVCAIDLNQDEDFQDDGDSFHDIPDKGEGIEVYESTSTRLKTAPPLHMTPGTFPLAFSTVLRGGISRGNVIDGAKNSLILGYYRHGGMSGITKAALNHTA